MEGKNVWLAIWGRIQNSLWSVKNEKAGVGSKSKVSDSVSERAVPPKTKLLTESVEVFLKSYYDFRYNVLTEETEYRPLGRTDVGFSPLNQRVLNTLCLEAHEAGIAC